MNASLVEAQATGADFSNANFQGTNFTKANVSDAKFAGALNLCHATFDNLRGAILDGLDLSRRSEWCRPWRQGPHQRCQPSLSNANLSNANLSNANLKETKFNGVLFDDPIVATGAAVASFQFGNQRTVRAGSIVFADNFIIRISEDHPAAPAMHTTSRKTTLGMQPRKKDTRRKADFAFLFRELHRTLVCT